MACYRERDLSPFCRCLVKFKCLNFQVINTVQALLLTSVQYNSNVHTYKCIFSFLFFSLDQIKTHIYIAPNIGHYVSFLFDSVSNKQDQGSVEDDPSVTGNGRRPTSSPTHVQQAAERLVSRASGRLLSVFLLMTVVHSVVTENGNPRTWLVESLCSQLIRIDTH